MNKSLIIREIEIRTWPERTDLLVIDTRLARVLAHYPLFPNPTKKSINDWNSSYTERSRKAVKFLEEDQEYLQANFDCDENTEIKLNPVTTIRERQNLILKAHDLSLEEIAYHNVDRAIKKMSKMDANSLYSLLCDWHDVVERHYPAGSTASNPNSWIIRANTENQCHWLFLTHGETNYNKVGEKEKQAAYNIFCELVDVDLESFSFGHIIRWIFFHKTEFSDFPLKTMKAFNQVF